MDFSIERFVEVCADYRATSALLDRTLYGLCAAHPGHGDRLAVHAKLWIVGRTYATGIERRIATAGGQGSALGQLAEHMLANAAELKRIFGRLAILEEPLTADVLKEIVGIHGEMTRLVAQITRGNQSPRSFVSKYMHFHCPVVPIIDSFAAAGLRRLVQWNSTLEVFQPPSGADMDYYRFTLRFLGLYRMAQGEGADPTVRTLDYYLVAVEEDARAAKGLESE